MSALGSLQNGQVTTCACYTVHIVHHNTSARNINNFFNSSETRLDGWKLLNSFLPQCPDEDFIQFCVNWMQNCCKIDDLNKHKDCAANLLSNLFKLSSNYEELKKSVSFFITSQYFDFFFKHLLNSEAGWNCTKNCLLFYRGACGSFQDSLQKHLANEIDKNSKISTSTAECVALLPCTGGGGNDGINYKKNWKSQFLKMLSICHSILNDLYADAEELKVEEYETEHTYNKTEKSESVEYLVIQLHNYTSILNCMLLNQYPAPKSIPSDLIFQLICRGLALNPKSLAKRQTTEYIALQKVLPHVHRSFLSLLKALITTCKNLLLPYSHLVCKLIRQTLEWTEMYSVCGSDKPFAKLRVSAFETLCNWLSVARNGSCVEVISKAVVSTAVTDIRPKKDVVVLKGKSQSKEREVRNRRVDATANSKLCYAALKSLQFLLKFAGVSMKPQEHKFLQEVVVELLLEIQKSPMDIVAPFVVPECRRELYSLLMELVHQPCTKWPPPTHFALRLFSKGVNDPSPDVSAFCSTALNFTTIIIHPQFDNGGFVESEANVERNQPETEIPWSEQPLIVEDERVNESLKEKILERKEDSPESVTTDPAEKLSDVNEENYISSGEDSIATITFSKDAEVIKETAAEVSEVQPSQNDEPAAKRQKISTEEPPPDGTSTPVKEKTTETPPSSNNKSKSSSDRSEESAQESTSEEPHPKKRYFLRSKTKGSEEEPDEAQKSSSSPESMKSTPLKTLPRGTPVIQSGNRPKTRALSRIETNTETETKTSGHDDDIDAENLKAVFDDSLVD